MSSTKEKLKEGIKKGLKRGYKGAKDRIKKYYEDYETLASPTKTIYYYEKTHFGKITKKLSPEDLNYKKWVNGVIEKFIMIGYPQVEHYFDTYDDAEEYITSITFNLQRIFRYDPEENRFRLQELQTIQQAWWREDYEEKTKSFWKEDYEEKTKSFWKDDDKKKELAKDPKELKDVKVEGSITFFINYKDKSIVVNMVIDVKDPLISEIYKNIYKDLIDLTKLLVKSLFAVLSSETLSTEIYSVLPPEEWECILEEDLEKCKGEIEQINIDIDKIPYEEIREKLKEMLISIEKTPDLTKRSEKIYKFKYFLYKSNLNQLKTIFLL